MGAPAVFVVCFEKAATEGGNGSGTSSSSAVLETR